LNFIDETFENKIEIKQSKFITSLTPHKNFKSLKNQLKIEHPKSRHIVWAYRYLNEYNQIVEDLSDDGEPKGSSAPPLLNVLRGKKLINVAILVVRYFGGTKLGIGGLVRAYGKSAKEVIDKAILLPYIEKKEFIFQTNYSIVGRYEHFLNSLNVTFEDREFLSDGVKWKILLSQEEKEKFIIFNKKNFR